MRVLNIHQREIAAAEATVGALLDSLASPADSLWPKESWPAMRFDRPLGVGAAGGHGPIRYAVEEFVPGRRVVFRFTGPRGFKGGHRLEILPAGEDRTILRHRMAMETEGPALLSWPLIFRPLHDELLEDALARAQTACGLVPDVNAWSPWVRFLRWALSGGKAPRQRLPAS